MDNQTLNSICRQVYLQFPEVRNAAPKIEKSSASDLVLVFRGKAITANGKTIPRIVRVLTTPSGQILKMTTSH